MVVDDDADLRKTIRLLFGEEFDVIEASNGRDAVEVLRKERPRLILLDITMPEMNGVEALSALRAIDPSVIVMMLTSECDIKMARKALDIGASAHVTKPFDLEFLRAEVRRLMSSEPVNKSGIPWRHAADSANVVNQA